MAALISGNSYAAYDVMERYKLIEDKLKTEDMLRPFGHDFLIDVNAAVNKDLPDFVDDMDKIAKVEGADSTTKVNNAITILEKWTNTEQTLKGNLNLGIPLFSFNAWGIKFSPDLRVSVLVGANLAIQEETITTDTIETLLGQDIPAEILNNLNKSTLYTALQNPVNKGADIIDIALTSGAISDPTAIALAQGYK